MNGLSKVMVVAVGLMAAASLQAQAPASAPAGSTGMCKDGSYYSGAEKKGACRGHKGVKDWYVAGKSAAMPAAMPAAPAPAAAATKPMAAAPMAAAAAATATVPAGMKAAAAERNMPMTAAPGGGAGQVWVNKSSKVYHCSTDKWYGKTKNGEYMSEAAAKAAGDHADHGKACAQ